MGNFYARLVIVTAMTLSTSGCLSQSDSGADADKSHDTSDSQNPTVRLQDKSGRPFANMYVEAHAYPVLPNTGNQGIPGTTNSSGDVSFILDAGDYVIIPGDPDHDMLYASNADYIGRFTVVEGTSSYAVTLPTSLFNNLSAPNDRGYALVDTSTITHFAAAFDVSSPIDVCTAGIGLLVDGFGAPAGTTISIRNDNTGVPGSTVASDSSHLSVDTGLGTASGHEGAFGGIAANFCESGGSAIHLNAGRYWMVADFAGPLACTPSDCLNAYGATNTGPNNLQELTSTDGTAWSSAPIQDKFIPATKHMTSLDVFLLE